LIVKSKSIVDVVVIGAGPGGCSAAITLARAGRNVVVIDKAKFPRDKCCGDGLTTGCLRRLGALGLDRALVPSWNSIDSFTIASPSGRIAEIPLKAGTMGAAAVARRVELDAALGVLARTSGAEVFEGTGCRGIQRVDDYVAVELHDGQVVRASCVVAADGARSLVQRLIPLRDDVPPVHHHNTKDHLGEKVEIALRPQSEWYAYRGYVRDISPYAATHMCVWFEEAFLPGYGWSFPLSGGIANIGLCVRRHPGDPGHLLADAWQQTLSHPFLAKLVANPATRVEHVRAWPIPYGIGTARLSAWDGLVLFVGDAARAADPMSGEGVGQALETGVTAARAIASHSRRAHSDVARDYERALRRSLRHDHMIAQVVSGALARPLGARAAVRFSGFSKRSARFVGGWVFEDFPRAMLLSPAVLYRHAQQNRSERARSSS